MRLRSAALTDIGLHRRKNEDRFLCLPEYGLYGVADGIGGLPAGAEAAAQTTEFIAAQIAAHPLNQPLDMPAIVASANAAVLALARTLSPFYGMGCTLTFCCVRHDLLHLAHVGDSRAYLYSGHELSCLTSDHSAENESRRRQARGEPPLEYTHANRLALTRCIGQESPPEVDEWRRIIQPGDRYLFCTDGLTNMVPESEIAEHLRLCQYPHETLRSLLARANARGGLDNITAVLLLAEK